MKAIILTILALSTYASACRDDYLVCHCYNSDGKPNNDATHKICDDINRNPGISLGVGTRPDVREYGQGTKYIECYSIEAKGSPHTPMYHFNNCDIRKACLAAGATGRDSSCYPHT